LLAGAACTKSPPNALELPPCTPHSLTSEGKLLPNCVFAPLSGSSTIKLSSLRGRPTVINFWASWCGECIGEMPAFQKVYASLGGKVTFLGMNVTGLQGETMAAGRAFAQRTGVRYLLAFDPSGLFYGHFQNPLRPVLPITVFVDGHGVVRETNFGALDAKTLRDKIRGDFGIT
jgi:thiol-disulfide isomerase/thioredoxin